MERGDEVRVEALPVLYVSVNGELGGAERVVLDLLRFHDASRVRPLLAVLRSGPLAQEAAALGVSCWVHPAGRFRNPRATWATARFLRSIVRQEGVRVVHGVMAMGHLYASLAAWGTAAREVWFQHGNVWRPTLIDRLAARVPAAMTFANSRDTAEAQRRIPNRTGGIQVVYCGVDLKRFSPDHAAEGERLRRDLGIVPGAPVVGMVGRFERWKGQHVFLRAAAHVRRRFPETVFLVAGDTLFGLQPGYKTELEQLALELGLKDSVRFLGFREDMPALYAAMDVVVHASTTPEPLGLVILEAMACARAVVAADAGGPRETVLDGVTGFLTPPGDPESLAERVISLLEDPAQRSRMGQAGRRRVEECFGMDRMARLLEDAYLAVTGEQS